MMERSKTSRLPLIAGGIILLIAIAAVCFYFRNNAGVQPENGDPSASGGELLQGVGTRNEDGSFSQDVFAMDTYMNLRAYGDNAEAAVKEAASKLYALDQELSVTNPDSDIARLNSRSSSTVGDETFGILEQSQQFSLLTGGCFDISVYPVVRAWGFTTQEYRVPDDSEISGLLEHVGYDKFTLNAADKSVTFADDQMELDTGAIAKGYAAQAVNDIMVKNGVSSAIISLGGTVCALGTKTDGSDWNVGIADPFDTSNTIATVKASDEFLVTSGSYERYFEKNGKTYHHIIDPFTGSPAESGLASVTIVSRDGSASDALSTALFVMGVDKSSDFWRSCTEVEFEAVFVTAEGDIYATEGLKYRISTGNKKIKIIER